MPRPRSRSINSDTSKGDRRRSQHSVSRKRKISKHSRDVRNEKSYSGPSRSRSRTRRPRKRSRSSSSSSHHSATRKKIKRKRSNSERREKKKKKKEKKKKKNKGKIKDDKGETSEILKVNKNEKKRKKVHSSFSYYRVQKPISNFLHLIKV